jgi:hypothetical protein
MLHKNLSSGLFRASIIEPNAVFFKASIATLCEF